jgi:hypothetical protein
MNPGVGNSNLKKPVTMLRMEPVLFFISLLKASFLFYKYWIIRSSAAHEPWCG